MMESNLDGSNLQEEAMKFQEATINLSNAVGDFTSSLLDLFVDVWNNLQPSITEMTHSLKELSALLYGKLEDHDLRFQAKALNLVSDRIIHLSYRKGKTGKKNLNRIRKQIKKHTDLNS